MTEKNIVISIFLIINTVKDIRKKEISPLSAVIFGLLRIGWMIRGGTVMTALPGLIPGLALIVLGRVTGGAVGMGDGVMLLIIGMYEGLQDTAAILLLALLVCALFGMILMAAGRGNRKTELPFVPFLMMGFLLFQFKP